jgi:hypothetical protein
MGAAWEWHGMCEFDFNVFFYQHGTERMHVMSVKCGVQNFESFCYRYRQTVTQGMVPPLSEVCSPLNRLNTGDGGWRGEGLQNQLCVLGTSIYEGVKLRKREKSGLFHFFCLYTAQKIFSHISIFFICPS